MEEEVPSQRKRGKTGVVVRRVSVESVRYDCTSMSWANPSVPHCACGTRAEDAVPKRRSNPRRRRLDGRRDGSTHPQNSPCAHGSRRPLTQAAPRPTRLRALRPPGLSRIDLSWADEVL